MLRIRPRNGGRTSRITTCVEVGMVASLPVEGNPDVA